MKNHSLKTIKRAVFGLAKDKAPTPDGFLNTFDQYFWDLMKLDLYKFFTAVHNGSTDVLRLSYSYLALIPKKQDNLLVGDCKPISLINRVIKILSKALSFKLSKYIDALISQPQTTFIKGRNVYDSI